MGPVLALGVRWPRVALFLSPDCLRLRAWGGRDRTGAYSNMRTMAVWMNVATGNAWAGCWMCRRDARLAILALVACLRLAMGWG